MLGFLLFFLYDVNSFTWRSRLLHKSFALGVTLLAAATVLDLAAALRMGAFSGLKDLILLVAGALCLAALVYCLFFALPFSATYLEENAPRMAYTGGMYALCRHPGVLWFAGAYLCLGILLGTHRAVAFCLLVIGLNIAYILFQDAWTFPKTFVNYEEYRRTTPFLLPTPGSAARCVHTWKGGEG